MKATYPKLISNWEGVPNNIDAALQYTNGFTYFFKVRKMKMKNETLFKERNVTNLLILFHRTISIIGSTIEHLL